MQAEEKKTKLQQKNKTHSHNKMVSNSIDMSANHTKKQVISVAALTLKTK